MTRTRVRGRKSRDARTAVQRAIDDRLEQSRADWAQRHPVQAAGERALRRDNALTQERWKHKNQGTPETHERASRLREGRLQALYRSGGISAEQLGSAVEIAAVAERIGADVTVKTASLETRVDVTRMGDGSFYERLGQVRREVAYTRWRGALQGAGQPVAAVLDMLVEGVGFTVAAGRHGMHHRRAKRLLIEALDLWPAMLGPVCREIDEEALARAHASLLARPACPARRAEALARLP